MVNEPSPRSRADDDDLPVTPGFREMALRRRALAESLVDLRRRSGLSQTQVAARMGTSQSAVAHRLDVRLGGATGPRPPDRPEA
jgi:predicted XRE-type DNA-binding protein